MRGLVRNNLNEVQGWCGTWPKTSFEYKATYAHSQEQQPEKHLVAWSVPAYSKQDASVSGWIDEQTSYHIDIVVYI